MKINSVLFWAAQASFILWGNQGLADAPQGTILHPPALCADVLKRNFVNNLPSALSNPKFMIPLIAESEPVRLLILEFVNPTYPHCSNNQITLTRRESPTDYWIAFYQKLFALQDSPQHKRIIEILGQRFSGIQKTYEETVRSRTLIKKIDATPYDESGAVLHTHTLGLIADDLFAKDSDPGLAKALVYLASGIAEPNWQPRKRAPTPSTVGIKTISPADRVIIFKPNEMKWLSEQAPHLKNGRLMLALIQESERFKELILEFTDAVGTPGLSMNTEPATLYFALLEALQNPGRAMVDPNLSTTELLGGFRRVHAAREIHELVSSIQSAYEEYAAGYPALLQIYEKHAKADPGNEQITRFLTKLRAYQASSSIFKPYRARHVDLALEVGSKTTPPQTTVFEVTDPHALGLIADDFLKFTDNHPLLADRGLVSEWITADNESEALAKKQMEQQREAHQITEDKQLIQSREQVLAHTTLATPSITPIRLPESRLVLARNLQSLHFSDPVREPGETWGAEFDQALNEVESLMYSFEYSQQRLFNYLNSGHASDLRAEIGKFFQASEFFEREHERSWVRAFIRDFLDLSQRLRTEMRNGHNHRDELRKIQTLAQERILPLINQLTNRDLHIRLPLLALEFEKNQEFNVAINDLREFVIIPVDALPTSFEDSGAPLFFRRAP